VALLLVQPREGAEDEAAVEPELCARGADARRVGRRILLLLEAVGYQVYLRRLDALPLDQYLADES
jgi:hypothetical protein